MDLTIDGNLHALTKEGNPPEDELLNAEHDLRVQYADAIGDAEYRMYCGVIREITTLELTIAQIHDLVRNLREVYVPVFANAINRLLHASLVWDVNDPAGYDNTCDRALNRAKGIKLRLDMKQIELAKLEVKYKAGDGKATREYYMGLMISLSDDAGFPVTENITVWEFCERIKRANKKTEILNMKGKRK
jgi:hypothetical protein